MKNKMYSVLVVFVLLVALFTNASNNRYYYTTTNSTSTVSQSEYDEEGLLYSGITLEQYSIMLDQQPEIINITHTDTDMVKSANEKGNDNQDVVEADMMSGGFVPINSNMYASQPLNIRSGPSADTDVIGYLNMNDTVNVVAQSSDSNWVKISYGGQEAFVNKTYLSEQKIAKLNLGQFTLTGYCACPRCCDVQTGITASGTTCTAGRTIAADSSIPFGTQIEINGNIYTVEDRGGAVNGNHIDIYFDTHQEAVDFAVQHSEVFMILD